MATLIDFPTQVGASEVADSVRKTCAEILEYEDLPMS